MSFCALDLAKLGYARPRFCEICGLGPCRIEAAPSPARPVTADDVAALIAAAVFPLTHDAERRDSLAALLAAFAAEIRRSAIEP